MTTHAFDVAGTLCVDVSMSCGSVRVTASDTDVAVATVLPHDPRSAGDARAAEDTTVTLEGTTLRVRGPRRRGVRGWFGSDPRVDVVLDVPTGTALALDAWADLRTTGRLGDVDVPSSLGDVVVEHADRVRVASSMGDVSVGRADGDVDLKSAAGTVTCGSVGGAARLRTSAGDVRLDDVNGAAELRTAAGEVRLGTTRSAANARTSAGSIRVDRAESGSLTLRTSFGDVSVGIPHGTAAWLDTDTAHGRVTSDLPPARGPEQDDRTVEVHARTSHGDVRIHRSPEETR